MFTVTTQETYEAALKFIEEAEILAYDTETTGLNFHTSRVIGFGVSDGLRGFYVPIYCYDQRDDSLKSRPADGLWANNLLLALRTKKLLMFNASFDYRMTKYNLGINLLQSLHADVLLMKHTCDEEFPLDLKGIAKKLWGHDVTKEKEEMQLSIKSNGGSATEYFKASEETISRYCVQDCLLTFRLFNYYSKELQRQGLEDFYYIQEVLPLYREVTIPMEEQGVTLDLPKMHQALAEISADLQNLESSIQVHISPHLSLFKAWFLNKEYPAATRTGKPSVWTKKFASAEEAFAASSTSSMFNLLSKHHLKKLFFDTLHETPLSTTPTGLPQVDEDFIESMIPKYPWCKLLIEYNKLVKLKSTYIERFLEGAYHGRFYPSFMQHRTVSGRLAGDLQQLPRPLQDGQASSLVVKYTNNIRSFFIADPGCLLCSADYEQLEPSIFAHTSGDAALQAIFTAGLDFYSTVAIMVEGLTGVSADKTAPNYLGRVNKAARQRAKVYALGIAYGMTGYKLQFEIGVPHEEAEELVKKYLRAFPGLASWIHASHDKVRFGGQVATESGRLRHMPRAVQLHAQYGARLLDSLQLWKDYNNNSDLYEAVKGYRREMRNLLNNAVNFQVQGLAASIVNKASIRIARKLKSMGVKARISMQVHDEIVLNVPLEEQDLVAPVIKDIMEHIYPSLAVPLQTTPQFGLTFKDCK